MYVYSFEKKTLKDDEGNGRHSQWFATANEHYIYCTLPHMDATTNGLFIDEDKSIINAIAHD